jgi:hypothetical protein
VLKTPATWPKPLKSYSSNYQLPARNLFLVGKVAGDKEERKEKRLIKKKGKRWRTEKETIQHKLLSKKQEFRARAFRQVAGVSSTSF